MIMFLKYQKKHRKQFILSKLAVFIGIVLMAMLAAHITRLKLPTLEHKVSWGIGLIAIFGIVILAFFNRIKLLFKIKSLGFVISWLTFLLLSVAINTLIWGLGLVSIVLIIDDVIVNGYFKYLNVTQYWDSYRDVIRSENK